MARIPDIIVCNGHGLGETAMSNAFQIRVRPAPHITAALKLMQVRAQTQPAPSVGSAGALHYWEMRIIHGRKAFQKFSGTSEKKTYCSEINSTIEKLRIAGGVTNGKIL